MTSQVTYADESDNNSQAHHDPPKAVLASPLSGDHDIDVGRPQNLRLTEV